MTSRSPARASLGWIFAIVVALWVGIVEAAGPPPPELGSAVGGPTPTDEPVDPDTPPTDAPPTDAPPTDAPPTDAPPTDAPSTDAPPPTAEAPPPDPDAEPTEVDLADPLAPVEAALDELQRQGVDVRDRKRTNTALQGEVLTALLIGDEPGLVRYVLEKVAEDGYQILVEPEGVDALALVALRARAGQERGFAFIGVSQVRIEGRFRRRENADSLRKITSLAPGIVVPIAVADDLRTVGYRADFRPAGEGELAVVVSPGRAIRRVRVRGYLPLSERDVRRVLSPDARPGALAPGECASPRALRGDDPPQMCPEGDLACRSFERDELERIEGFLFDNGYLRGEARLLLRCGRDPAEADIIVKLDKGPAYKVRKIIVAGNPSTQDQRWIRRVFRPKVGPFLPIPKRITRKHIEEAKERVAREYASPKSGPAQAGRRELQLPYPGVRVDTSFDDLEPGHLPPGRERITLEVRVQLGHGVRTAFLGNERISENRLRRQLQLFKRREPANASAATREAANLRNFYQSRGFLLAEVEGRYQDFGKLKQLTFVIREGPRGRIRQVAPLSAKGVPATVLAEVRRELEKSRKIKPRGRFTDSGARADLVFVLNELAERGYLCAYGRLRLALWPSGFDEEGASASLTPAEDPSRAGEPAWIERDMDPSGLTAVRKDRRVGMYVRYELDPGPRVVTSNREKVRHLEQPIGPDRDVENLPQASTRAWGAPRILRDGPLRRKDDERVGGIPLSLTLDREVERDVVRRYQNSGYPVADAEVRWIYTDNSGVAHRVAQGDRLTEPDVGMCREQGGARVATVDAELAVYEGRRAKFGTTLVRGNFKTRTWVLRREVTWKEGEDYSKAAVDRSRRGIEGTGVVESVAIREQPRNCDLVDDPDAPCTVNAVVSVVEAKDRALDLSWGLGGQTLDPFYVFLRPSFPNLFGTAWDLHLDGHLGTNPRGLRELLCSGEDCYRRSASATLERRRIFASPLTLTISGEVQRRATPARGQIDSAVGQVRLTWPITDKWSVYAGYLIQAANISKDVVKPTLGSGEECEIDGTLQPCRPPSRGEAIVPDLTGALQTGASWTDADKPFNPDDGMIATASSMIASPWLGGRDWWFRYEFSWEHFIPLPNTNNRLNFRYSLIYGHSIPLPNMPGASTTSIPEVWRWFGGGTRDLGLRGIEPQTMLVDIEAIPLGNGVTRLRPTAQGGHIRAFGTVALQVVSVRNFLSGRLAHSLFFDFGVLTQRWSHVVFNRDFRRSVGVNFIKWDFNIATVSLGYAVLVPNWIWPGNVRPTDDHNGRFVFDVGATF